MSLKNDVARLKRLGNRRSPYWVKIQKSIIHVIVEVVIPLFPNRSVVGESGWHELPWRYDLKHSSNGVFQLRCWKEGRSVPFIAFSLSNTFMDTKGMLDFAHDISNGWLDEVKRMSEKKS